MSLRPEKLYSILEKATIISDKRIQVNYKKINCLRLYRDFVEQFIEVTERDNKKDELKEIEQKLLECKQ